MSEQRGDLPPGTILGMILNENARLRAELAAEREDVWKMRDVALRAITGAIAAERERAAGIAKLWADKFKNSSELDKAYALLMIPDAIRTNNVAPPRVEPSAAESEPGRRIGVYVRRADQLLGLQLARIMDETNHPGEWKRAVNELRALVLKTFGEKK